MINISVCFILMMVGIITAQTCNAAAIQSVVVEKDPSAVRVRLTGKVPYKVVQFDKKEILVAFKKIKNIKDIPVTGNGKPSIRNISIYQKKQDVVSIVITTGKDVQSVSSVWIPVGNTLLVKPRFSGDSEKKIKKEKKSSTARQYAEAEASDKKRPGENIRTGPDRKDSEQDDGMFDTSAERSAEDTEDEEIPESYSESESGPPSRQKVEEEVGFKLGGRVFDDRFDGSIDDLFLELRSDACDDETGEIKRALVLCKQKAWRPAYEIFNRFAEDESLQPGCLENMAILKAFCFFKELEENVARELDSMTAQEYLAAADAFQTFISYFPGSVYTPYALACLGKIYERLKDYAQAEGYFKIVLKVYYDYPGTPEVMFELGRIYGEKQETRLATAMLKKVVTQFPHGKFIGTAKFALGKALFNQNDFYNSIKTLEEVLQKWPRMIFEEPELLHYIGNAYYHTNQNEKARATLAKVYNLFPDLEGRDTILTRIGDTYVENKEMEKAISIFRLVVDKYPGTDGFVISSMRLAEFLESADEKKELYNMVIRDFPDNPLSRLALMRLAILAHKEGDYEESVATVKQLLATQPRALRTDAVNLLLSSSEEIFRKQLSGDEYTALLKRFETDRRLLNKSDNPELFLLVGLAYLKAHLYDTAVEQLMKSYKRTGKNKRPPELFHALGKAMKALGRNDEAYEMFKTYERYFKKKKDIGDVYFMMGEILLEKKKYEEAVGYLKKSLSESKTEKKKAAILVSLSIGHKEMKKHNDAVTSLVRAINMLAGEPEDAYDTLALAHRNLGDNYMALQNWAKASDAYNMAIKFSGPETIPVELYFMLGESYEKGREFDAAEKAYNTVVENGDSFWSSMAKERLRGMKLNNRLEKT